MKKMFIFLGLFFLFTCRVNAEEFTKAETLDKVVHKNIEYSISIITKDNKPVYLLNLYNGEFNSSYDPVISGMDINTRHYMNALAYFGYGYHNHTDKKWYSVTQYLILKCMGYNDIKFEEKYKSEIEELIYLTDDYFSYPTFIEGIKIEENIKSTFEVMNNLEIKSSDIAANIDNNILEIEAKEEGNYKIDLIKHIDLEEDSIYSNSKSMLLYPGKFIDMEYSIDITVEKKEVEEIIEDEVVEEEPKYEEPKKEVKEEPKQEEVKKEQIEKKELEKNIETIEPKVENQDEVSEVVNVPNTGKNDIPCDCIGLLLISIGSLLIKKTTI